MVFFIYSLNRRIESESPVSETALLDKEAEPDLFDYGLALN